MDPDIESDLALHPAVRQRQRPLELAEVHAGRELRHDAGRRCRGLPPDAREHGVQRRHPRVRRHRHRGDLRLVGKRPALCALPARLRRVSAYHKVLPSVPKDLEAFLDEVRLYARGHTRAPLMGATRCPGREPRGGGEAPPVHRPLGGLPREGEPAHRRGPVLAGAPARAPGTVGRLDARFIGPTFDLLAERAEYDPQSAAISAAYTAAFLAYYNDELKFGRARRTMSSNRDTSRLGLEAQGAGANSRCRWSTRAPISRTRCGQPEPARPGPERLLRHRHSVPRDRDRCRTVGRRLRDHIEMKYYPAGHMMYILEPSLKAFKADVAGFIDRTSKAQP